ncbi:NAD(P)H-dependent flavin oxidoreductase [Brumimicrobium aurantiacum]|uniref:Nitronate monooxygenase n=1 Tax=Brumimicrobium aurantiacum TaxID=1737063 RepID=A0A3E1EZX3_9FLAO|nr:nitronate monooxygenase [Brumimicrobium aurantiacum]RFC55098.1 nitronate monooxygenase [Brumimicrobium aurantiacum]
MENSEIKTALSEMLDIRYPIILAPMFLVSNTEMIISAIKAGATGAIPAMNYRTTEELKLAIREVKAKAKGPFGINLIVNKSNFTYKEQLAVICEEKVDYIITSLGSPKETIDQAHKHGIKVFCDVTTLKYAQKVESLGADAIIAVNKEAGGHAGNISIKELIPELKKNCKIPVISAGGVGNGYELREALKLGAEGCSIGSVFIASEESGVNEDYKQACIDYGKNDIVMTSKLSGTPCTVIKTPYVEKIGTDQNWLEKLLNKNKKLKKWFKAFTFIRGMKTLQKAAFSATYKTLWCAGPTIENVKSVRPIKAIIDQFVKEYHEQK